MGAMVFKDANIVIEEVKSSFVGKWRRKIDDD
jgi:hypothetical protein